MERGVGEFAGEESSVMAGTPPRALPEANTKTASYPLTKRCAQRSVRSARTKVLVAPPAGSEPATRGLEGPQH